MVTINASDFQSADDGDTTHYGGTVTVSKDDETRTIQCWGTDRGSHNCYDEVLEVAYELAGVKYDIDDNFDTVEFMVRIDSNSTFQFDPATGEYHD